MSHEIRTPMNGVIGMLNVLEKTRLTPDQAHKFRLAKSSAESLLTLINDILDFSKIEAGKLELEQIDFDLCELIGDLSEAMSLRAEENDVTLSLDTTGVDINKVKGDPTRIRQILTNLIGNAVKFTHRGNINVALSVDDTPSGKKCLHASITDSGIGIAPEKVEQLFDSFTQEDASTTRKYGGTGLGLAICKFLCELMDGKISVESEQGKGSCFSVELYLEKSEFQQALLPQGNLEPYRVLVVSRRNVSGIIDQLLAWGLQTTGLSSLGALSDQLELKENGNVRTAIFIDHQFVDEYKTPFLELLSSIDEADSVDTILMKSMSDVTCKEEIKSLGYFHSFPLPATKYDLLDAVEVLSGAQRTDTLCVINNELQSNKNSESQEFAKLLLVEDNAINREVVLGLLEDEAVDISIAENGVEAIKILFANRDKSPFDVILMDCQMPLMDGYECAELIRQGEAGDAHKQIPIIALTANAMQGDKERCLAAGMDDYLSKPVDVARLKRALKKWVSEPEYHGYTGKPLATLEERSNGEDDKMTTQTVVWDTAAALGRVRDKPERLVRLLTRFLEDIVEDVQQLHDAVSAQDCTKARRLAHTIKGVAANLGAERLRQVAFEMEKLAEHEQLEQLVDQQPVLDEAMADLIPLLERFQQEHGAA